MLFIILAMRKREEIEEANKVGTTYLQTGDQIQIVYKGGKSKEFSLPFDWLHALYLLRNLLLFLAVHDQAIKFRNKKQILR